jgi:DNA polymerase IV
MTRLCRDCLHGNEAVPRCRHCGSPRLLHHPERDELSIAHIDCDAFYASVEKRDNPTLIDKPVIIGGGKRGVVSTACYLARIHGVRSAMPMFKALALCPQAVVIRPDMEKYVKVGRDIRLMMLDLTPLVEPLSIDEAFLDLTGTERLHHATPAESLVRFARRVESEIGVTVSVGLSHNKFLAKIASDLDKPRGFSVIGRAETSEFLAAKPVSVIWGVGKKMQERLALDGIRLISDLRRVEEGTLLRRYGKEGGRLFRLCRGIDSRSVSPERETKSVSSETTLDENIADPTLLKPILWRLAESLGRRLAKAELAATSVTLKLKTHDFRIITRAKSGFAPTCLPIRLYRAAEALLEAEAKGTAYRLIGIGVHDFAPVEDADKGDLLDQDVVREAAAAKAIDALRGKFGNATIQRGLAIAKKSGS